MFSYPLSKHLQDSKSNGFFSRPFAVFSLSAPAFLLLLVGLLGLHFRVKSHPISAAQC